MGVEFEKKIDFKKMNERIQDAIFRAVDKQIQIELTRLKARTKKGTDADGGAFKPYASSTIARKKRQGKNINSSWLEDTGQMMGSLQTKTYMEGETVVGEIFPMGGSAVRGGGTASQKIIYNQKSRRFFAFGKEQIDRITQAIRAAITKL